MRSLSASLHWGHTSLHSFTDYVKESAIKEATNITKGKPAIEKVLEGFGVLLEVERDILNMSADANDEGTNSLMSDYIQRQEKLVWMYSAFLK